jgi:hypothetical protein
MNIPNTRDMNMKTTLAQRHNTPCNVIFLGENLRHLETEHFNYKADFVDLIYNFKLL